MVHQVRGLFRTLVAISMQEPVGILMTQRVAAARSFHLNVITVIKENPAFAGFFFIDVFSGIRPVIQHALGRGRCLVVLRVVIPYRYRRTQVAFLFETIT